MKNSLFKIKQLDDWRNIRDFIILQLMIRQMEAQPQDTEAYQNKLSLLYALDAF